MKALSLNTSNEKISENTAKLAAINPHLVLVFGPTQTLQSGDLLKQLTSALPNSVIAGVSTAGQIANSGTDEHGLVLAGAHFEHSKVRAVSTPLADASASFAAGEDLAKKLIAPDLKAVYILAPGLNINGTQLVRGITAQLPAHVTVSGGLAGDGSRFQETVTILSGSTSRTDVVAIGFYGERLELHTGSRGGWKPFGPVRRITKSNDNVLYELDGKPALDLYKEYLGEKASGLPATGLLYPFALLDENRTQNGLIRTILNVDPSNGSLTLAGDMPQGSLVSLMHADTEALAGGASEAAKEAMPSSSGTAAPANHLALCVSCVGRRLVMGQDADEEVDATLDVLGKDMPIAGFYSYGEISPYSGTGKSELHNQTMTITTITER